MKRAAFLFALVLAFLVVEPRSSAQQPQISPNDLVGTWTLVTTEPGGGGQRVPNPRGVLILDGAGHIFEAVTRANRQQAADAQPKLTDQQLTLAMYTGFWGRYRLEAAKKTFVVQTEGGVSPNVMGRELMRTYEVSGDQLVVTSPAGEPHVAAGTRWTWERVPVVDNLSPMYRQVVGFWQHVVERRVNLTTGATISETRRAPSIIVYTPSGYVGVHFPPLNRQKFAGAEPTEAEARAALTGFVGYFGALSVYPNMVFHQVLTGISPGPGNTLKRPVVLKGDEVTINFPPTTNQQGQQMATQVVLRRLSGADAMLP
jgi:hypothetical protein